VADPAEPDWRATFAGEDKDMLGFLGRYQSPKAFAEAAKKDRDAVRNKQVPKLADNATEEEVKAYRAELGVPDDPKGYLEKLPEGLLVGSDDAPFVETFMSEMHKAHAPPALVNAAVEAYYRIVEDQIASEAEEIATHRQSADDLLRQEWGPDYRRNVNAIKSYVQTLPNEIAEIIAGRTNDKGEVIAIGTDADGMPLANNPKFLNWLAGQALDANPLSAVLPGTGTSQADSLAAELATLKTKMGDRSSDYWKGPLAAKNQERYRVLTEAQLKIAGKA
jgi:hypothetical protein